MMHYPSRGARPVRWIALLAVITVASLMPAGVSAQFGYFGKNKVIYESFDWQIYRAPHFDVYYYPEEEQFLDQIVSYAESAFLELTKALDHEPTFRIPLIYYKNHGDFEQTNIDLDFIGESTGAFAEPLEKRMVLPIDQPPDRLYKVLKHELVHIFEFSILFQDSAGRALRGSPPGWLMEGLASYLAEDETSFDRMFLRDAVVNGLLPPITQVRGASFLLAYRYGNATFAFIEQEFGPEGIRSFLMEYRKVLLTSNIAKPIKESFGVTPEEFDRRFRRYLEKKYVPVMLEHNEPEDHGKEIGIKLPGVSTFSPTLSPSGDLIAVLTNKKDDVDVVIINAKDGEMIRNLTKGLTTDYDYLIYRVFSGKNDLSWSPGGDQVAVFARRANKRLLLIYNAVTGKRELNEVIDVDQAESPAFSPDGKRIAFAGNKHGQVDIFEYNIETKVLTNITNDSFYDSNPSWSSDGRTILYNRRINAYEKVFLLDYEDPAQKTQVTFGETTDVQPSFSRDGKRIYYSSDAGGNDIFNIYSLDLETGEVKQYTDLISGSLSPRELPEKDGARRLVTTAYGEGRFRLFTVDLGQVVEDTQPGERLQEPAEVVPFKPSLQLTLDESEKRPYDKLKFHLESQPAVLVGVASDGTVIGDAYLLFADLLGDHRIWVYTQAVASYTNIDVGYVDLKHRLQWFVAASDFRDFVVLPSSSGGYVREQANRVTLGRGGLIWPFSTNTRFQGTVGVVNRDVLGTNLFTFGGDDATGPAPEYAALDTTFVSGTSPYVGLSLVNDTTRYKSFGAWHGKRINLSATLVPAGSSDLGRYNLYSLDFRSYQKLTRRSLIAWRFVTDLSEGEGSQLFSIGGYNQIRGFRYREFLGDRAAYMNLELRFPLVDEVRFPFGSLRQVRGLLFFDAGTAWTQDGWFWDKETGVFRDFKLYDKENDRLRDLRASYGIGFSFRFGFFDLNWNFAKRLPYTETQVTNACRDQAAVALNDHELALAIESCPFVEVRDNGFHSDFYIGYSF